MPKTIGLECSWCKLSNQTMDLIAFTQSKSSPDELHDLSTNAFTLCVKCRNCSGFVTVSIEFQYEVIHQLGDIKSNTDITRFVRYEIARSPKLKNAISSHIPTVVAESLKDAYEATRPRAKCAHFRSALEFAVRSIDLDVKPGEPLGVILKNAQKSFALPPALIELCDQVKAFGNWGLHWSETDILESDADAAKKITEAIIMILFELPALVEDARERTKIARDAHKNAEAT